MMKHSNHEQEQEQEQEQKRAQASVWMVSEDWTFNEEGGHSVRLFWTKEGACTCLRKDVSFQISEGDVADWKDRDDYHLETDADDHFECWLEDDWLCNHYEIWVEEVQPNP